MPHSQNSLSPTFIFLGGENRDTLPGMVGRKEKEQVLVPPGLIRQEPHLPLNYWHPTQGLTSYKC